MASLTNRIVYVVYITEDCNMHLDQFTGFSALRCLNLLHRNATSLIGDVTGLSNLRMPALTLSQLIAASECTYLCFQLH